MGEVTAPVAVHAQGEGLPRAHPMDVDAAERGTRRATGPAAAQQRHLVTALDEPLEDLVEMNLGTAGKRILPVLPVDDENSQVRQPILRASASRTPLTNRALGSLPNRSARRTHS